MSVEAVKAYLKQKNKRVEILTFKDTSTVAKAADSLGVSYGEIAKSLLFKIKEEFILIVMPGDKRIDNRKFKDMFKTRAKMPSAEEVLAVTGHPAGGVCPFGLKEGVEVYLDRSLQAYDKVYPAAGETNTTVEINVDELEELTEGYWIDVAQSKEVF